MACCRVPAPATAILLEGFASSTTASAGERVTPTGAAILRHLCDPVAPPRRAPRRLVGSGHGFGTRKLPGSQQLPARAGLRAGGGCRPASGSPCSECEIDDQTGEDLASGIERLRAHAGVLDVDPGAGVRQEGPDGDATARARRDRSARETVLAAIFEETTTIGVRHALVERMALPRRAETVEIDGRRVGARSSSGPSGPTAKAEADDVAGAGGHAAREALRRRAEERA